MDVRAAVVTGLRWVGGTRLLTQGFSWVVTIIVVRILAPADYGTLAIATTFTGFLSLLSDAGLANWIVQTPTLDDSVLRKIFGLVLLINVVLFGALFFGAPLIALVFEEERLTLVVRTLALAFLLAGFTAIPEALLDRRFEFRKRSLVDLSSAIFASLLTLSLALLDFGVWALVYGALGQATLRMLGLQYFAPSLKAPLFAFAELDRSLRFGSNVVLRQLLWSFYTQADLLIAGKLLYEERLGVYAIAMHLASLPAQRLSSIIYRVTFPAFSRLKESAEGVGESFRQGISIASFIGFPLSWGISSVAPEIAQIILGPKWGAVTVPLTLLGLIMPLRIIAPVVDSATEAVGRAEIGVRNMLVASVVMPIAFFVGCRWGLTGLSLAWVLVYPLVFVQNISNNLRALSLRARDFYQPMLRPAFGSACMFGAVASARLLIEANPIIKFALMVLIGASTYAVLMLLINRHGMHDVLKVMRHR
jgi:teichuronic acid exporter